jgi:hypothetical protein
LITDLPFQCRRVRYDAAPLFQPETAFVAVCLIIALILPLFAMQDNTPPQATDKIAQSVDARMHHF